MVVEVCRSESDDVGVGWGKDWGKRSKSNWRLPVHGDVASDHDGPHEIAGCVRPARTRHVLLPRLGAAGQQDASRAVGQEDGHGVVVGLTEELARRRRDDLRDCDYPRTLHIHLKELWHRSR